MASCRVRPLPTRLAKLLPLFVQLLFGWVVAVHVITESDNAGKDGDAAVVLAYNARIDGNFTLAVNNSNKGGNQGKPGDANASMALAASAFPAAPHHSVTTESAVLAAITSPSLRFSGALAAPAAPATPIPSQPLPPSAPSLSSLVVANESLREAAVPKSTAHNNTGDVAALGGTLPLATATLAMPVTVHDAVIASAAAGTVVALPAAAEKAGNFSDVPGGVPFDLVQGPASDGRSHRRAVAAAADAEDKARGLFTAALASGVGSVILLVGFVCQLGLGFVPLLSPLQVAITGFMLSNGLLTVVNKAVLTSLPCPACLMLCQCVFSSVCCRLTCSVEYISWAAALRFSMVPISMMFTIFANLSVMASGANLETVIVFRASMPLVIIWFDYFFLGRCWPCARSVGVLVGVFLGVTWYAVSEAATITTGAWLWLAIWYAFNIFDTVYIKHVMTVQAMSSATRTYYANVIMSLSVLPLASREAATLDVVGLADTFQRCDLLVAVGASCVLGLGISACGFGARQAVSATWFESLGLICKLLTILMNATMWGRHASSSGLLALNLCLIFSVFYVEAPMRNATKSGGGEATFAATASGTRKKARGR
eukprot:TRINITY_DN43541_c0_g1_i1.p1 TRINITY_DN43541_c0_g1~~TRINITY_DN43541_c0_g1_i1.p1  ORF type:complete len:600 (-),score=92.61 TRINITY_DN43541_c0_g1_i1:243-2042(-)